MGLGNLAIMLIDVYKRQTITINTQAGPGAEAAWKAVAEAYMETVSYTHLDVYKRQLLTTTMGYVLSRSQYRLRGFLTLSLIHI